MSEQPTATKRGVFGRLRHGFGRAHFHLHRNPVTGLATKIVVTLLGLTVIGAGLVMMVTPGPGLVAIIIGLGILATEWHWAERWMHAMKAKAQQAADAARDMDPAVRRRRLALSVVGIALVATAVVTYVRTYDWPRFAVTAWDWVQRLSAAIPELPGM